MEISTKLKAVAALLIAISSIAAAAEPLNDRAFGRKSTRLAQEFNESRLSSVKTVRANQLVNSFDLAANNRGEIRLIDSSGKVDIKIWVTAKENTLVKVNDGRSEKSLDTYRGSVNGHRAILVRSEDRLSISWIDNKSGRMTLREFVKNGPEKIRKTNQLSETRIRDDVAAAPPAASMIGAPTAISDESDSRGHATDPLNFYVFVHSDMGETNANSIHAGYFSWWLQHLTKDVLPNVLTRITYIFDQDGITNIAYRNLGNQAHDNLGPKIVEYANKYSINYRKLRNMFLLLTEHNLSSDIAGFAASGSGGVQLGIASNDSYITPAHEFGHLMAASHKEASVHYYGWWCDTIMHQDYWSGFRTNCNVYSEKNIENIRKRFRWRPDLTPPSIPFAN
ncbi:hypothetical protein [Burkholderia ubonensis]|uniref:hypothetical protein n=1 Tax=Burkholderia ubonensis TaxID=101571 RepID=UPI000A9B9200|nr:hypothetical protein [Burkholderia ubonensis]